MLKDKSTLKKELVEMVNKIEDEQAMFIAYGTVKAVLVEQEYNLQGKLDESNI